MSEEIQRRLSSLRSEYERGQERLRELRKEEIELRETLLRIEGAVTVLQEFIPPLSNAPRPEANASRRLGE